MTGQWFSYCSPKLEVRAHPEKGGEGLHAKSFIAKDELLAIFGGKIVTFEEAKDPNGVKILQVDENLFIQTTTPGEPSDYFNHSCEPNAGFRGQVGVVAMREIAEGEEVTFDYAMCDGSAYDEFQCACGALTCRRKITGNDWQLPLLWKRYAGYFSPYLQRRIDAQKKRLNV